MTILEGEKRPPFTMATLKELEKLTITTTPKGYSGQAIFRAHRSFQQLQGYVQWKSQDSPTPKPLMKESTATITYEDKGKGKVTEESSAMLEYSQVVAAQEVHQLIKESMVSSSTTTTTETLQEAKPKNAGRDKIYQPKYRSQRAQQRHHHKKSWCQNICSKNKDYALEMNTNG